MNHGPLLFLGVFVAAAAAWFGVVIGPHLQFGNQEMVVIEETGQSYPVARSGEALQGAEVYRANGCNYCHTQQVRPAGEGADLARGWGKRRTVARDYLRDQPVMLGNVRFGPDLANLGLRETNALPLLLKLYNPRIALPASSMPRYPYLFEQRRLKPGGGPSPEALPLAGVFAPPPGFEVVPKPEAYTLVAYLLSLRSDALFLEVLPPLPPKPATNATETAVGDTNAVPAATSTNAPSPSAAPETNAPTTPP